MRALSLGRGIVSQWARHPARPGAGLVESMRPTFRKHTTNLRPFLSSPLETDLQRFSKSLVPELVLNRSVIHPIRQQSPWAPPVRRQPAQLPARAAALPPEHIRPRDANLEDHATKQTDNSTVIHASIHENSIAANTPVEAVERRDEYASCNASWVFYLKCNGLHGLCMLAILDSLHAPSDFAFDP